MRYSPIIAIIVILTIISSCSESKKLKNETLRPYPTTLGIGFQYKIYHNSSDVSTLYIQTYSTEYRVTIRAYEDFRSKNLIYEHTQQVIGAAHSVQSIPIPIRLSQYALEVLIFNPNDSKRYSDAVFVDKTASGEQSLLAIDENETVFLKKYIPIGKSLLFESTDTKTELLFIRYFDESYRPALPPHIPKSLLFSPLRGAKNTFSIPKNELYTFPKKGLYFIQSDTSTVNGIFINAVDNDFPKLTDIDELTLSIRYIAKNEEYKRLTSKSTDAKVELDRFWLARAGDKEKARKMIRLYYNRVQLSNEYFTSYKAGWKTDRGIVFTIFGKPTKVQKTERYEYWYYKRTSNRDFVAFIFDKPNGIYILRRNPQFAQPWGAEVFAWRMGNLN
ncbi:MAG: GWxTD domain-containing protein [Cognaticolwellia sp.]|jgi:GWxTD domain-containing protein